MCCLPLDLYVLITISVRKYQSNKSKLKQRELKGPSLPLGLPWWLSGEESARNTGDLGLINASGRSLEEGMALHSSILTWRIPWTEEPGRLRSIGLQRVGHADET